MGPLIRDLIHFEEVEEVIKIRKEERAREYVEKYIISDSLRRNLLFMLEMLSGATHKSFNVVGNYGTGKSHFLAFAAALLEHPEYRALVRDEQVRSAAEGMKRRYLVVKFELGAAQEVSLRYIFFDQVQRQLLDRYDIEVRSVHMEADYDNKQNVQNILGDLKAQDPEAGLVVIVDEISDFLKQKDKQGMSYDIALLRELGEVSQDSDFFYIGAMQEHVFTNPKYVDQAESIARVNQRFVTVTITKEDVAQVLTNRVVRKDPDQRLTLAKLLDEHRQYFPSVAEQLDRYVDLFPIHPYVIDVFERLPYFENRGIIGFTVQNVKPILDQPAPVFVTFDRVFDLITATREVRNQPDVARVVRVVETLQTKADLLDARFRGDAQKLIKALGVLNLLGGEKGQGATSQELANTLLITPPSRLVVDPNMARDHIERVMKNIRDVTVGQYIDYAEGRYSLNLEKIEDYDALIEKKAQASVLGQDEEIDRAFREFIAAELGLTGAPLLAGQGIYADTAPWPSRRSFRPGLLVIGRPATGANYVSGDYRLVLQGPVGSCALSRQDEVILATGFTDELTALLVRARAAQLLGQEKVYPKVMTKLAKDALDAFRDKYLTQLLANGTATYGGHKTSLKEIPAKHPLNALPDLLDHVEGELLDAAFQEKYPEYPALRTLVTAANLESEMTKAVQSLDRIATQGLDLNTRGYLESFGAMKDGQFSASASPACRLILQRVDENDTAGKVTPLDDIVRELAQAPWGLPVPMVQLLIGALLYHGYLVLVRHGGARLGASDVGPLLKNGLAFFADIRYLERDKDIDVEAVAGIFNALGLQPGLVRNRDSRTEAVKALRLRGGELKTQLGQLRGTMQGILAETGSYPGVPWASVFELSGRLDGLSQPLATFADASRVSDLGKLDTTPAYRTNLTARLADMESLGSFVKDWQGEGLAAGLRRMREALAVLPALEPMVTSGEKETLADLRRIVQESQAIYTDASQLLRADLRRPLKGKVEQFRQKYDPLYYGMHGRLAGDGAPWDRLAALRQGVRFRALSQLKGLPFIASAEFTGAALEIQRLEQRRCRNFNAQVLDAFVACPYCRFPEDGAILAGLPARIEGLGASLENLWVKWQAQVLSELPALQERLPLLSPAYRAMIEALAAAGKLPDDISADLLAALYELASELQPVELDMADLAEYLLAQGGALTVEGLRAGIEAYLTGMLKGYDRNLVRIKLTVPIETGEA